MNSTPAETRIDRIPHECFPGMTGPAFQAIFPPYMHNVVCPTWNIWKISYLSFHVSVRNILKFLKLKDD